MFISPFFSESGPDIHISPQQGSLFAKQVAGDFNPIHDSGNNRFCVPGDLLFALVLASYGLSQRMAFRFTGMVGKGTALRFPQDPTETLSVRDPVGKTYLEVIREGDVSRDEALIESLIRTYVAFSGRNFPHILVPLMERYGVMINTERPLVIYEQMSFELEYLDLPQLCLDLVDSTLEIKGKRGDARLYFQFRNGNKVVGSGQKKLVLSGLRELDSDALQGLVDRYAGWAAAHRAG